MLEDDVCDYLVGAGIGLSMGSTGNLFKGTVPETTPASQVISIIEYGGRPALRSFGPSIGDPVHETARFQVAVIDQQNNYQAGRTMIESIYRKLDNLANTVLGATTYLMVTALQPPFYMPPGDVQDPNLQHHFTINFEARKARG